MTLNAAAALVVAEVADTLGEGLEAAAAAIDEGRAGQVLTDFTSVSNDAARASEELE